MSQAQIVQFPVGPNATQVWSAVQGSADQILYWNADKNHQIYLGFQNTISVGSPNTIPVPPNGSFQLAASRAVWVAGPAGSGPLVVIPDASGIFRSLTQGLGELAIPALFSPDFVTGLTGWSINKDGSAEFNDLKIRGTFFGVDWEINSKGAFFYSGPPALGNLVASIAGTGGSDDGHGNPYDEGFTSYDITTGGFMEVTGPGFVIGTSAASADLTMVDNKLLLEADGASLAPPYLSMKMPFDPLFPLKVLDPSTDPSLGIPETWHLATITLAGWANQPGGTNLQYTLKPGNLLYITGELAVTGGAGTLFTLPNGWKPAKTHYINLWQAVGAAGNLHAQIQAGNGVVSVPNPGTTGTFFIGGSAPMDGI